MKKINLRSSNRNSRTPSYSKDSYDAETGQPQASIVMKSSEVKKILKCSDSTIHNLRKQQILIANKIGGTYYYSSQQIKEMLSSNPKEYLHGR